MYYSFTCSEKTLKCSRQELSTTRPTIVVSFILFTLETILIKLTNQKAVPLSSKRGRTATTLFFYFYSLRRSLATGDRRLVAIPASDNRHLHSVCYFFSAINALNSGRQALKKAL